MGSGEFRRQLEYKAAMRGGLGVVDDRFFASSKLCSCGHKMDALPLSVGKWTCPNGSETHDRDVNAAIHLMQWAASSAVTACGKGCSGARHKTSVKPID